MKHYFLSTALTLSIFTISIIASQSPTDDISNNKKYNNCAASFSVAIAPYEFERLNMVCKEASKLMGMLSERDQAYNASARYIRFTMIYDHKNKTFEDTSKFDSLSFTQAQELFNNMDAGE